MKAEVLITSHGSPTLCPFELLLRVENDVERAILAVCESWQKAIGGSEWRVLNRGTETMLLGIKKAPTN